MVIDDELAPPRAPAALLADLTPLSVGELEDYVATLRTEMARAQTMIERKRMLRGGAGSLFRA